MAIQVCNGAQLTCSFGTAPSSLLVLPTNKVLTSSLPAATVQDMQPFVNILPFAMCTSMANPTVVSATAAAMGVLTPMPCIPVPAGIWVPGVPKTLIGGVPAIDNSCTLTCAYGGVITITNAGQQKETIG